MKPPQFATVPLSLACLLAVWAGWLVQPACSWALEPEQVAIVVRGDDENAARLAAAYAKLRGIPGGHVLAVPCGDSLAIGRDAFVKTIQRPLAERLTRTGLAEKVRCLVLMHPLPLIIEPAETGDDTETAVARKQLAELRNRLAELPARARTVGRNFPAGGESGAAFPEVSADAGRAPADQMLTQAAAALDEAVDRWSALRHPPKYRQAGRQLVSLHRQFYGLEGLLSFVREHRFSQAPAVAEINKELAEARKTRRQADGPGDRLAAELAVSGLAGVVSRRAAKLAERDGTDATVDSELALLWAGEYPIPGPRSNPLYWKNTADKKRRFQPLMVARLDGPTRHDVLRMLQSARAAERRGPAGRVYIDAGGPLPEYDEHLRRLAAMVANHTPLAVKLDTAEGLFARGDCPDALFYVGWSSPGRYISAFSWAQGAVGWHIAGAEAAELRTADSRTWCVKMIQNGVAGTVGAVKDPRLGAFPMPEEFFALLLTGRYTLAECYWRTVPHASWRMVLLGDPLYNPFKDKPQLPVDKLPEGLAP